MITKRNMNEIRESLKGMKVAGYLQMCFQE